LRPLKGRLRFYGENMIRHEYCIMIRVAKVTLKGKLKYDK